MKGIKLTRESAEILLLVVRQANATEAQGKIALGTAQAELEAGLQQEGLSLVEETKAE